MKNVLITGCSGLLGTYLIKKFLTIQNSYKVIGVDIVDTKLNFKQPNFVFEKLDLTSPYHPMLIGRANNNFFQFLYIKILVDL